jgi:hypothetical protein
MDANASTETAVILGAFAELRKAAVGFVMSICLSVCLSAWNNSAPDNQIFVKFNT